MINILKWVLYLSIFLLASWVFSTNPTIKLKMDGQILAMGGVIAGYYVSRIVKKSAIFRKG